MSVLRKFGSRTTILMVLAAALAVSGCSTFKKKPPTLAYQERPVELLYSTGAAFMDMAAIRRRCSTSTRSSVSTPIRSGRDGRS
jgi:hypothetical protein